VLVVSAKVYLILLGVTAIKTEVNSNDIMERRHDNMPSAGMFGFFNDTFHIHLHCDQQSTCMFEFYDAYICLSHVSHVQCLWS